MLKSHPWWLFWLGKGRWITIYPHVYHPKGIEPTLYPAIVAHEDAHLWQQKNYGRNKWILKYLFNRRFRLAAEAEGIATELSITKEPPDAYAKLLCSSAYLWAARSIEEAKSAIALFAKLL